MQALAEEVRIVVIRLVMHVYRRDMQSDIPSVYSILSRLHSGFPVSSQFHSKLEVGDTVQSGNTFRAMGLTCLAVLCKENGITVLGAVVLYEALDRLLPEEPGQVLGRAPTIKQRKLRRCSDWIRVPVR
jgi:hypothetical protein